MPVIQTIDIKPVSFKLKNPFITAGGRKTETHNVQIAADAVRRHARAGGSFLVDRHAERIPGKYDPGLKSIIPELHGKPIENYRELVATAWRLQSFHPTAAAAMECAILDAYTRTLDQPLANFLGRQRRHH